VGSFDGIVPNRKNLNDYVIQQHIMRYILAGKYVRNKVVLDVACGAGYGTCYLAERGGLKVYAIDINENALSIAKEFYNHPNIVYIRGDALNLPFPNNFFDVVVSFETIEHITQIDKYIRDIKRILKVGGLFICSTPNIKYTRHPHYHIHEFYPDEFFSLLEKNFCECKKYAQYISPFIRLKDAMDLKERLLGIGSKILNKLPQGKLLKTKLKRTLDISVNKQPINTRAIKIYESFPFLNENNNIVPINSKKGYLRIMIGVCKKYR